MESYALFATASYLKVNALAMATVSDHFITQEKMSPEQRQESFKDMMKVAVDLVQKI